jgi:hypothetical protein
VVPLSWCNLPILAGRFRLSHNFAPRQKPASCRQVTPTMSCSGRVSDNGNYSSHISGGRSHSQGSGNAILQTPAFFEHDKRQVTKSWKISMMRKTVVACIAIAWHAQS